MLEKKKIENSDKVKYFFVSADVKERDKSYNDSKLWIFQVFIDDQLIFETSIRPYTRELYVSFSFEVNKEIIIDKFNYRILSQQLGSSKLGKLRLVLNKDEVKVVYPSKVLPGDTCHINDFGIPFYWELDILDSVCGLYYE